MKNTRIGWCHHTVNFWWGCSKVSPACEHCYAETLAKLFSRGKATWGPGGLRWVRSEAAFWEIVRLNKSARERGVRERVFINSMSDTFEDRRDLDEERKVLFSIAPKYAHLDFLLLTKRPENILRMVPSGWLKQWPENVWVGATVENQHYADLRIPELLKVPARVRFISVEPMLGALSFGNVPFLGRAIQWVICGGESGAGRRELDLYGVEMLYSDCFDGGVPFFMKQDSGPRPGLQGRIPDELWVHEVPA